MGDAILYVGRDVYENVILEYILMRIFERQGINGVNRFILWPE